ncbi:MAG: PDZ domain-containing protein [Rhodanobacteraceae bacterium]
MKRTLAFCLLLPFTGAVFAAPPASTPAQTETDASIQQQMDALQARMRDLASQMATLSTKLGDEARASALGYFANSRRGMLGMAVSANAGGLRVDAVTPGGPAERAGLKSGDSITAVDGKPVGNSDDASETALWNAQTGRPIALTIDRGGKSRKLTITPERLQSPDLQASIREAEQAAEQATARVRSPEFQRQIQRSIDEAMKSASAARSITLKDRPWIVSMSPWFGLNLAPINPGLGSYFGTQHGALVLSRDQQLFPELQPGDVITAAGGKAVTQPEDVLRAFRDTEGDASVRLALRRHDKTITLAMKVPPHWNVIPPPPPPPVPRAPSAPPSPAIPHVPVAPPAPPPPPSGRAT